MNEEMQPAVLESNEIRQISSGESKFFNLGNLVSRKLLYWTSSSFIILFSTLKRGLHTCYGFDFVFGHLAPFAVGEVGWEDEATDGYAVESVDVVADGGEHFFNLVEAAFV